MWDQDASPLSSQPLSDPFLQLLSMSPKTFPGEKTIPQMQSHSARSSASSTTPQAWPQSSAKSASHQILEPHQKMVGFADSRCAMVACSYLCARSKTVPDCLMNSECKLQGPCYNPKQQRTTSWRQLGRSRRSFCKVALHDRLQLLLPHGVCCGWLPNRKMIACTHPVTAAPASSNVVNPLGHQQRQPIISGIFGLPRQQEP